MSFLNGALALGALTALVPLFIHLFNRSRFKVIKWGASHLLESVLRKNRKQIQLEQWIILIIRCAIPIILALTLARMVVTDWNAFLYFLILPLSALALLILTAFSTALRWPCGFLSLVCLIAMILGIFGILPDWGKDKEISALSGDVPASTVILLDDSLSMNISDGFIDAGSFISDFLKNQHKQSEISIIQIGGIPLNLFDKPTSDENALGVRVENLDALSDQASLLGSLDQALSIVSQGKNLKREIILLSDFRESDWNNWDNSAIGSFRKRLDATPNGPELTWVDFGKKSKKNLSVENIVVSSQTIGIAHPLQIRATLRNLSEEKFEGNLQVQLLVDGDQKIIDEAAISIGPQATNQVSFSHSFDSSGPKVLHVELIVADDLPQDNRRSVAVSVIEEIGILLVDGDPSKEWLRGETDFLKIAMTPFKEIEQVSKKNTEAGAMKDLIDAQVISIDQFKNQDQLDNNSLVVLANVEKLDSSMRESLELFVRNGGGVLITAGSQINLSWYNENWGHAGTNFIPMELSGFKGKPSDEFTYSKIVNSYFDHPALSMFNDPRNGSLAEAQIMKWVKFDEVKVRNDPTVTVLARLHNGDPILVEKKIGKGIVMTFGTSIDTDWTNLPARPSFLPFVQQLSTYLSEKVLPPRTVKSGLPLTHYLSEKESTLEYKMDMPNGSTRTLVPRKRKDKYLLEFTETRLPGTYKLSNKEKTVGKFVVLSSIQESILTKADEKQITETSSFLAESVNRINGIKEDAWEAYERMDNRRKFGRETWMILLAVLLGLILMEVILLRKFCKGIR